MSTIRVDEVAYHRNGVSGEGFHAVLFRERNGRRWRKFLASVFEGQGVLSVVCIDMLPEHGVNAMANAWRGDYYEPHLRRAIEAWTAERDARLLAMSGPAPHKVTPTRPRRQMDV